MPWEKTFSESDVIDQVMHVFWEKGYDATSISDLTEATGIKRGSLYNAFDGKRDLFLRSLIKYDREKRKDQLRKLAEIDDPRVAISTFFDFIVNDSLNTPGRKGCMLVNTSLDFSRHDEAVQKLITDAFNELTEFFESQIIRGQKRGDIPASVAPRPTALALVAMLSGLRTMGRGTFGEKALQQIADQAKRLIA